MNIQREVAFVNMDECIFCGACEYVCDYDAPFPIDDLLVFGINADKCHPASGCGEECVTVCPVECISMVNSTPPDTTGTQKSMNEFSQK